MENGKSLSIKQCAVKNPLVTILAAIIILYAGYLFGQWVSMVVN